jgi:hypothetical protein
VIGDVIVVVGGVAVVVGDGAAYAVRRLRNTVRPGNKDSAVKQSCLLQFIYEILLQTMYKIRRLGWLLLPYTTYYRLWTRKKGKGKA